MTDERIKTLREEIKKGKKLNAAYLSSWFDELRYKINKISL